MNVTIVDYGIGNILSVKRAFEHLGIETVLTRDPRVIKTSDRIVVPGVGAFNNCMIALKKHNLLNVLTEFCMSEKPFLGICVGMQMLLDKSYEFGEHKGLGIIPGEVKKISVANQKIPFIGWKRSNILGQDKYYYFVHSYSAHVKDNNNLLGYYNLSDEKITSAIKKNNVIGVQFHPEKSSKDGLEFLKYFTKL